jgi:hypothetical protein
MVLSTAYASHFPPSEDQRCSPSDSVRTRLTSRQVGQHQTVADLSKGPGRDGKILPSSPLLSVKRFGPARESDLRLLAGIRSLRPSVSSPYSYITQTSQYLCQR